MREYRKMKQGFGMHGRRPVDWEDVLSEAEFPAKQTRPAVNKDDGLLRRHIDACTTCRTQFLLPNALPETADPSHPTSEALTFSAATQLVTAWVAETKANSEHIGAVLEASGDRVLHVLSIEGKKGQAIRQRFLTTAYPDIPFTKHFLIEGVYLENCWENSQSWRTRWLLPYLTLEWSADPTKLLSILEHRSSCPGEDWALLDAEQVKLGYESGALSSVWYSGCICIGGDGFGTVVPYDEDAIHSGKYMGFSLAQHIFRAQLALSQILVRLVDAIVDPKSKNRGSNNWKAFFDESTPRGLSGIQSPVFAGSPHLPPPCFAIEQAIEFVKARQEEAEDHLSSHQRFPQALATLIRHAQVGPLQEHSKLLYGASDPTLFAARHICWTMRRPKLWGLVASLYEDLQVPFQNARTSDCTTLDGARLVNSAIPLAFASLAHDLNRLIIEQCRVVRLSLPEQRAFGPNFLFVSGDVAVETQFKLLQNKNGQTNYSSTTNDPFDCVESYFRHDPCFYDLYQLSGDPHDPLSFNRQHLHERFLEHLSATTSEKRKGIGGNLLEHVSDLRALEDLAHQLRLVSGRLDHVVPLPQSREHIRAVVEDLHSPLTRFDRSTLNDMKAAVSSFEGCAMSGDTCIAGVLSAEPDASRMATRQLWERFRASLSTAWIRSGMDSDAAEAQVSLLDVHASTCGDQANTCDSVDQTILAKVVNVVQPTAEQATSTGGFEHISTSASQPSKSQRRNAKRRGAKQPDRSNASSTPRGAAPIDPLFPRAEPIVIAVKTRSFRIFMQIFDHNGGGRGDMRFRSFQAAMIEAGCTSMEQGDGADVIFRYPALVNETGQQLRKACTLHFHAPHPSDSYGPNEFPLLAIRLFDRLGWSRETFVLRAD
ncbi:hypothetical protein MBLNU230_g7619t1 [Neophaeotheca triangularis]